MRLLRMCMQAHMHTHVDTCAYPGHWSRFRLVRLWPDHFLVDLWVKVVNRIMYNYMWCMQCSRAFNEQLIFIAYYVAAVVLAS